MGTITFTIEGLGQKVVKSVPADVAGAWLAVNELPDIEAAVKAILLPIVRTGTDAKAKAETEAIMASLES